MQCGVQEKKNLNDVPLGKERSVVFKKKLTDIDLNWGKQCSVVSKKKIKKLNGVDL